MSNVEIDIDALIAACSYEREHGANERDLGYKGCDCDRCEATRRTIVDAMPEVLRRLKAAEATVVTMTTAATLPFRAPLKLGDRFQRRSVIYTVVDGAAYEYNGYALLNLAASHAPYSSRTWSGWGWSLYGLAKDIINDSTALTRLPRLTVAPTT